MLVVPTAVLSKLEIVTSGFLVLGWLAWQGTSSAPNPPAEPLRVPHGLLLSLWQL